jgi:hypothetical protein
MKDKVAIRLEGGIGNNLFQIACAYAYSLKHNKELVLVNEKFGSTHSPLSLYKDNILRKINFLPSYDFSKFKIYNEPFFHYQEIPFIEGDVYLTGYYQSELYFKEYEKEIRELFDFPEELINSMKEKYKNFLNKETCSVHVRRGNYLQLQHVHPIQNINYYMKAIRTMSENALFFVFSDDIEFCKSMFPNIPEKFIYIQDQEDYLDLLLMNICTDSITANSSFSWWGAWLRESSNEQRIVVSPSVWFGKNINHNTKDLYCKNWIII